MARAIKHITSRDEADKELRRLRAIYRREGWPQLKASIMRVERIKASLAK